jgi:hypothetical protein
MMVAKPHKLFGKRKKKGGVMKNNQKPFAYLLIECHWHALMVEKLCKIGSLLPKFLFLKWWRRN